MPARKTTAESHAPGPAWPFEEQERGDFLHRVRMFPPDVRVWREALVDRASVDRSVFPRVPEVADREKVRELVDAGISAVRELTRLVEMLYGLDLPEGDATSAARVIGRIGLHHELGLSLGTVSPRNLDAALEFVPPNVRATLRRGLARLGSDTCKRVDPACGRCEARRFCATWRQKEQERVAHSTAPTMIDLFAGAGGLSEGFRRAGFRCLAAADMDAVAMRTYRLNHPEMPDEAVMVGDVRELKASTLRSFLKGARLDVLIGAPPCQGFSSAGFRSKRSLTGYRTSGDARNYLFEFLVSLALELKPRLFLMENVPGMETARKENLSFMETAAKTLQEGGYQTRIWKLAASSYGVPQERMRCFLVGVRGGPPPGQPVEEYQNVRRPDFDSDALPRITFNEATFDLPKREAATGAGVETWSRTALESDFRFRRYLGKFKLTNPSQLIWNHFVRYHNENDLELYALLKPGEDSVHAIERYDRPDLMKYRRDVFDDKYARLRGDTPSKTIVAHLAKDGNGYIHPTQTRDISIREAARLQSFQDDYIFCGAPSDQWVQIGNAVPPILGEAVARTFQHVLAKERS